MKFDLGCEGLLRKLLGEKNLARAVDYVRHQKQHHHQAQTIAVLERDMDEDDGPAPWNHGEAIAGIKMIGELTS